MISSYLMVTNISTQKETVNQLARWEKFHLSPFLALCLFLCVCVFISLSFLEKLQHTLFRWPRISHFSTPWLRVREVSIQVNWRITWARFPFLKEVSLSHKTRLRFLHGDNYTYSKFQNKVRLSCAVSTVAFVCFY